MLRSRLLFIIPLLLVAFFLSVLLQRILFALPANTVKLPDVVANEIIAECNTSKQKETCYTNRFAAITHHNTLAYTLSVLSALQQKDAGGNGCHFIAHVIAGEEVAKDPSTWEDVIKRLPVNDCTGGYIMGVMEARSTYEKNVILDGASLEHLCSLVRDKTKQYGSDQTCAHTIGHLLLVEKAGDVAEAVAVCDSAKSIYQYECHAGIFMEHAFGRNLAAHGVEEVPTWSHKLVQDRQLLCKRQTGLAAAACWRELSHMFIFTAKSDPVYVYDQCSMAPTETMRDDCYLHAVGVMTLSSKFDPERLASFCDVIDEGKEDCIDVVKETLLSTSPTYSDKVKAFCHKVPAEYKMMCSKS